MQMHMGKDRKALFHLFNKIPLQTKQRMELLKFLISKVLLAFMIFFLLLQKNAFIVFL